MKPRILIVDDEPSILNSLKHVFRKTYEVFVAPSAEEALVFLQTQEVEIIISDMRMPNMNGAEFLIQTKCLYPNVESILLTGYSDVSSIRSAIFDGEVFGYLAKPCDKDELRELVSRALTKQQENCAA